MNFSKSNWPLLRVVRAVLSAFFLFDGVMEFSLIMLLLGLFLGWQAIANAPCTAGGVCQSETRGKL